ncbi:fatty acid desaturase [Luteolibacter pohnpeiensis]|uniref:Fatty acid desaturase n=2 Tax=Luteolibacter pohnpeiensis TaxID=454153 RepID=A0A934SF71_9BACT|nr:fatty acid desaturase [Luteolibacter pohnpeiensis]MBK1884073.1 fatty acid desaturase [Luteolibacter pohnpeiensis]
MYRIPFSRVNWITSSFLIGTALIALIGVPIYIIKQGFDWFQFAMFFVFLCATMMSITVGYHRLFSHIAFKAKMPVRLFTLIFGAWAFENSCLDWASDHRRHHKHVDHDDDPYDISKGFFWAHIGWLLFKLNPVPPMDNVNDLRKDKLVMWQHRWVHLIGLSGLIIPAIMSFCWNSYMGKDAWQGALGGFLIAGVLRVVVAQHCTFFINSLCHTVGRQPYSTKHSARDSAIMAFLTFGEGYHNYHHEFQHDYRNGVKPWQWDPSKWTIWTLSKFGLADSLRRVPDGKILLAEMREARRRAQLRLEEIHSSGPSVCQLASASVHEVIEKLSSNYHELEKAVADRVQLSREKMNDWQTETRQLIRELGRIRPVSTTP